MARVKFRVSTNPETAIALPRVQIPRLNICEYRGDAIGKLESSCSCSSDKRIFACAVKGRCVSVWSQIMAPALIKEAAAKRIQNCADCQSMKPLT